MFKDRKDAGQRLAEKLSFYKGKDGLVLGIPRGGVIVAAEIARKLNWPLDVIVPRKIGTPHNPEVAIGAVTQDGTLFLDIKLMGFLGLEKKDLQKIIDREIIEIKKRLDLYRGSREPLLIKDKTIIIVDDGIATGYTLRAALESLKKEKPKEIILAVPVATKESLDIFEDKVDKVIILEVPEDFYAVGQFYVNFEPITHDEVIGLLKELKSSLIKTPN